MPDRHVLGDLVSGAAHVEMLASDGVIKGDGIKALAQIFDVLDLTATPMNLVVRRPVSANRRRGLP